MDNEHDIVIKKQNRRDLLATLKLYYPASADFRSLRLTLPDVEAEYMRTDLSYLIDKGYVQRVDTTPNRAWDKREFRLTATGVETADRINNDPALEP